MATYAEKCMIAHPDCKGATLLNRVEMASIATAIAIANEDPATAGHYQRKLYAQQVLNSSEAYAPRLLATLAGHGITDASTDADLDDAIPAIWNALAGA